MRHGFQSAACYDENQHCMHAQQCHGPRRSALLTSGQFGIAVHCCLAGGLGSCSNPLSCVVVLLTSGLIRVLQGKLSPSVD
jgi:hypothetical protein